MARSWIGLTIFACLPCIMAPQWLQSAHSYEKSSKAGECYETGAVSRKILSQTRLPSALRHKGQFAYECLCREALAMRWDVPMGPVVSRDICQNFGNIREYFQIIRVLLELMGTFLFCASAACHPVSILED